MIITSIVFRICTQMVKIERGLILKNINPSTKAYDVTWQHKYIVRRRQMNLSFPWTSHIVVGWKILLQNICKAVLVGINIIKYSNIFCYLLPAKCPMRHKFACSVLVACVWILYLNTWIKKLIYENCIIIHHSISHEYSIFHRQKTE